MTAVILRYVTGSPNARLPCFSFCCENGSCSSKRSSNWEGPILVHLKHSNTANPEGSGLNLRWLKLHLSKEKPIEICCMRTVANLRMSVGASWISEAVIVRKLRLIFKEDLKSHRCSATQYYQLFAWELIICKRPWTSPHHQSERLKFAVIITFLIRIVHAMLWTCARHTDPSRKVPFEG